MLDTVHALIVILTILLTAAFAYQGVFMLIGFLRRRDTARYDAPESPVLHPYAALISARSRSICPVSSERSRARSLSMAANATSRSPAIPRIFAS